MSQTMLDAYEYAKAHGGIITRHQGGFWAKAEGWDRKQTSFGAATIIALVQRELAIFSKWQPRKLGGEFPVEITLVDRRGAGSVILTGDCMEDDDIDKYL